ncbi:MAG TPA: subtype B tannase [Luteimicrobium sp.]|nr:subtype B tannase [Luteimicrobium sp.]
MDRIRARVTRRSTTTSGAAVGLLATIALAVAPAAGANPGGATDHHQSAAHAASAADQRLRFDPTAYTTLTVTVDGTPVKVRWYKEICYVANPVLMASTQSGGMGGSQTIANPQCGYQSMNLFVPESAWHDTKTAIYFAENNSGWMASYIKASVKDGQAFDSATSNVGAALKAGYVFADVATRSRGVVAADGSYAGKAPAVVVDAKAAVRYLRLNDAVMPGSAERIVVNGTSGGGGLGAILGASGNSTDYLPYLEEIGAAGIDAKGRSTLRDDVFAVNLYCPITDLGNADVLYEWLFNVLGTRADTGQDAQPEASAEIASQFAAYEKSLGLTNPDGTPLTARTILGELKKEIARSAVAYMKAGNTIPDLGETFTYKAAGGVGVVFSNSSSVNDWIDVDNAKKKVVSIDIKNYLDFLATQASLKGTPAFDAFGVLGNGTNSITESTLFGTSSQLYSNYTAWSWNHNDLAGDGVGLDDTGLTWAKYVKKPSTIVDDQLRLINPMAYLGTKGATSAPYWYVRVGTRDRDTAPLVSLNLDRKLQQDPSIKDVNYQLAWMQPHAGNYDVPEAMAWIAKVLEEADTKGHGSHR